MNKSKTNHRKSIQELSLIDDFLFSEAMFNKETAELVTRLILERALGINAKHLIIEPQKTINGIDTERHGIRMDVSITEKSDESEAAEIIRVYDIEPNIRNTFSLPKRSRYYQAVTDIKLLSSGTDYDKLPELITIWILPYDPFGKNMMIYHVKNIVEEIPEMNYNDGIRKIFLYTDGENGGSDELKKLLSYIRQSRFENVTDESLKKLHHGVEEIKRNSETGVRYMQMWEIIELEKKESRAEGKEEGKEEGRIEGIAEGMAAGRAEGREEGKVEGKAESILELLEELSVVPDSLKQTVLSQKDMTLLNRWHKLSAKVNSIDEFMEKMSLC